VTGTFQIAQFRYVYSAPIEAAGVDAPSNLYPEHDEVITTVLLDCAQHLAGTLATEYRLRGASRETKVDADADVLMMQTTMPSTVVELCRFLKR
jgi:hypothetical protein